MPEEDKDLDRFTLYSGDLEVTEKGEPNPHGYSWKLNDGTLIYYDDDGEPVNPEHRPIHEDDLAAAERAFQMNRQPAEYLEALTARYGQDSRFAGAVIAKAARRALKKVSAG
jgi:hypothetical protein